MLFIDVNLESRYKLIVQVVIGERHGAGIKSKCRCIWDADTDSLAFDQFLNVSNFELILYILINSKYYTDFLNN